MPGVPPGFFDANGQLAWTPDDDVWELYNLEEDWSQANDLSAQMLDKLAEMQALFEQELVRKVDEVLWWHAEPGARRHYQEVRVEQRVEVKRSALGGLADVKAGAGGSRDALAVEARSAGAERAVHEGDAARVGGRREPPEARPHCMLY